MIKGIIPPVVTLLDAQGNFDYDKNKRMLDFLIEKGVHGLLLLGSSGEFPHFSLQEKKDYLSEIVPYLKGRIPLLVGTGGTVIEETIELSNHAAALGVDGVLVVNPYYWQLSDEQMVDYFNAVAKLVQTDVYLYNIPQLTGQDIPIAVIEQVAQQNDNVRGIKETVSSMTHIRQVIREVAQKVPNFHVYSAFDEHLLDAQLLGATGSINGTSVFLPELSVSLYEAIQAGDFEKVKSNHVKISHTMDIYTWHPSFYLTMKEGIYARLFPEEAVYYRTPFINTECDLRSRIVALLDNTYSKGEV